VRCCAVAVAASTTGEARLARRRVDPGSPGVDWATNLLHLFVFFGPNRFDPLCYFQVRFVFESGSI
jgi:hypothetical protein